MKNLVKRAQMISGIRNFFSSLGYLEVETPIRIPAPIPEEHIEPFESDGWYLQSSPEICMKRLAAIGYEKIFQICKCFRKDERGDRHLTELTMLEWYRAGFSYMELMDECREMIRSVAASLNGGRADSIDYRGASIRLDLPWEQLTVEDAFEKYGSTNMWAAEKNGTFDEIMSFEIEPELGKHVPAFIYDYPASRAALSRLKIGNPDYAERFELYIAGIELANGFSELIDPVEQCIRLQKVLEKRDLESAPEKSTKSDKEDKSDNKDNKEKAAKKMQIPEKFIADLGKMPPTAGIALGVDRLAMIFTGASTIDEVVAFTPEEL